MAGRKKGTPKTGGRQKGTPNKTTKENRQLITDFIFDDWEKFIEDVSKLSERERVDTKIKLISFVLPKQQAVENNISFDNLSDSDIDAIFQRIIKTDDD